MPDETPSFDSKEIGDKVDNDKAKDKITAVPDGEAKTRTPSMADYFRVFRYATKWDFAVYAVAALASVGAGVTLPLMNIIFGQLVGQFTDYFNPSNPDQIDRAAFERLLNRQALYVFALFVGRWGLNSVNKFCFRMIGIRLSSAVRLHYLQALFAQPIHVIDAMPPGAAASTITSTSNTLQIGISERLGTFLQFNGTIWSALIVAFIWSWDLTLVTSSLVLYTFIVLAVMMPPIVKAQSASVEADVQGNAVASEALGGIRQVMAAGAQRHVIAKYNEWVDEARKRAMGCVPPASLQFGLMFFGVFGAFGLAFWYGTQRFIAGALRDAGVVIIVLMSVMMIFTSLERIATPLLAVSKAMVAACEFFTVIDAPLPRSGTLRPDIARRDIVFEDAHFAYPSRPSTIILEGLNLRIPYGKNTAIVGPSGSGKSTVVALLERWFSLRQPHILPRVVAAAPQQNAEKRDKKKADQNAGEEPNHVSEEEKQAEPTPCKLSGSVKIGEHNLEDLDLKWWRSQIGLVQQEPFLFNDTIYCNVANGLIGTQWADEPEERKRELVKEACRESYAHEFISRLPDGYDTRVGDGGTKLSGGQKQRIALARSIVKKPTIMVLDEATSALDAKGERIVQAALNRVIRNRTTVTIAHRLSTIRRADNIVVMQAGRAVEQGTHEELVADPRGVYCGLVKAQMLKMAAVGDSDGQTSGQGREPVTAYNTELDEDVAKTGYDNAEDMARDDVIKKNTGTASDSSSSPTQPKPRSLLRSFGVLLMRQRAQWPWFISIVLVSMCVAAATPLQAWLFAQVVNVFLLPQGGDEIRSQSSFWGLMWLALAGGVGVSYAAQGWTSLTSQYHVSAACKKQYLRDMLDQRVAFFDDDAHSHGALSARIGSDAKQLEELMGVNLAFLVSGSWTVVGCVAVALAFGWKLGLVALFVTMPVLLGSGYWKYRHEVQFDEMNSLVFADSSQFATEAVGAIRTVYALTMEAAIGERYRALLRGHVDAAYRKALWTAALFGFADSASLGCQALVFFYGGKLLASREYDIEAFLVCFMAIIQGAENASSVLAAAPSAAQAKAAANRILDIEESADAQRAASHTTADGPQQQLTEKQAGGVSIELRDISFKYPTRNITVIDDLSLTIEKGQYAALVGPSGCGKTTIISLLERFYDVDTGTIFVDGVPIGDSPLDAYRRDISLVAQEPTLFRGTMRDNVLFGVEDPSSVSEERLHQVCRDAFIHDFIISLPEGYDTDIGFKGLSMSGGQKQRVALARALIREPRLLLLDEATSALDSESEKVVLAALEQAREGRTVVAVAHRLSTIQNADVIFVLDEGKVIEKGTHDELVANQGVYWGMCQAQALDQ